MHPRSRGGHPGPSALQADPPSCIPAGMSATSPKLSLRHNVGLCWTFRRCAIRCSRPPKIQEARRKPRLAGSWLACFRVIRKRVPLTVHARSTLSGHRCTAPREQRRMVYIKERGGGVLPIFCLSLPRSFSLSSRRAVTLVQSVAT